MNSDSVTAENIKVHFQGVKALDGVDLVVHHGEILGLIGPNGAGKTTLVNALTGFQRLTAGDVRIGDEPITGLAAHLLARRGLVRTFQGARYFRDMTVAENVEVAAVAVGLPRAEARAHAIAQLEFTQLSHRADAKASSLTHGEERRLGFARAAATNPSFIFLDEPAAGLDEAEGSELVGMIRSLRDRLRCGVLLIEHDMTVIMRACERIQVLNYGQTISVGTPDEVRRDPDVIEAYLGTSAGGDDA